MFFSFLHQLAADLWPEVQGHIFATIIFILGNAKISNLPKGLENRYNVHTVQKGKESIFLSLFVLPPQQIQIRKNQTKILEERSFY